MATYSTVLNLKLNQGSDPFLLSDFIANWEILDANPGIYTCTSLTRPSWGANQAGRVIFMTDLKQFSYWDGASWQDPRTAVPVFAGGQFFNTSMARNTSPVFTVMSLTTPRPCAMSVILSGTYNCSNQQSQDVHQSIIFDGSRVPLGNYREQIRFEGDSGNDGSNAGGVATSVGVVASINAGVHTIGVECDIGSDPVAVLLVGVKVLAFISVFNTSNVL